MNSPGLLYVPNLEKNPISQDCRGEVLAFCKSYPPCSIKSTKSYPYGKMNKGD